MVLKLLWYRPPLLLCGFNLGCWVGGVGLDWRLALRMWSAHCGTGAVTLYWHCLIKLHYNQAGIWASARKLPQAIKEWSTEAACVELNKKILKFLPFLSTIECHLTWTQTNFCLCIYSICNAIFWPNTTSLYQMAPCCIRLPLTEQNEYYCQVVTL